MSKSIMIVGVGGQGTLLASRILGNLLTSEGYDVKVSEVHGMSQRGGSVVTYVKYGDKVFSPVIDKGEADVILAFEMLEAYRALGYLKEDGIILANSQTIPPISVIAGKATYPENIKDKISSKAKIEVFDAMSAAIEIGNVKAANVVLIGILARKMNIPHDKWIDTIKSTVPEKFIELNIKAFEKGFTL